MARRDLARCWFVARRGAPHGCQNVGIVQHEPIVGTLRRRDAGEPSLVHRAHEKIARSIPGENAPRPVRAVSGRRQTENEDSRERISEAGDRPSPVGVVSMRGFLFPGDLFAIRAQPRTAIAADNVACDCGQWRPRHPADDSTGRRRAIAPARARDTTTARAVRIRRGQSRDRARFASVPRIPPACNSAPSAGSRPRDGDTGQS